MIIYKSEIESGLKEQLVVGSTQAICRLTADIPEIVRNKLQLNLREKVERAFGASSDQFDLFPLYTILVSTGWNKNDDVFGRVETWKARYTPEDKPFNIEHNPSRVIGHITASCPIDEQFLPLGDDIVMDDLPSKYHILTSAVIYQPVNKRDPEWSEQLAKIIEEVKNGDWCVSMECLFNDFDYAVADLSGKQSIVQRNEETAFLTKHLRMYGGEGSFQDKKLGRYLKNITFSGKGLVKKPANPDSVIFTDTEIFSGVFANIYSFSKNSVNTSEKENQMTDFEKENTELKTQLAELNTKLSAAETSVADTQKKVDELTESISVKDGELVKANELIVAKDGEIAALKGEKESLTTANTDLTKKTAEAEEKISSLSVSLTRANRTISLYQYDLSPDEVKNIVDKFISLADEQFNDVVQLIAKKKMKKEMGKEMEDHEEECASTDATTVVETAAASTTEIPANSAASETVSKVEKAVSDLREYFGQMLNKKVN